MSGKLNLGRVRPVFVGPYRDEVIYHPLERVEYQGNIYECMAETVAGTRPAKAGSAFWARISVDNAIPKAVWEGTELSFEYADGTKTDPVDLRGPEGEVGPQGEVSITSDLTSTAPDVALSALAGKKLKDLIDKGGSSKASTAVISTLPTDEAELAKLKESLRDEAFVYATDEPGGGFGGGGERWIAAYEGTGEDAVDPNEVVGAQAELPEKFVNLVKELPVGGGITVEAAEKPTTLLYFLGKDYFTQENIDKWIKESFNANYAAGDPSYVCYVADSWDELYRESLKPENQTGDLWSNLKTFILGPDVPEVIIGSSSRYIGRGLNIRAYNWKLNDINSNVFAPSISIIGNSKNREFSFDSAKIDLYGLNINGFSVLYNSRLWMSNCILDNISSVYYTLHAANSEANINHCRIMPSSNYTGAQEGRALVSAGLCACVNVNNCILDFTRGPAISFRAFENSCLSIWESLETIGTNTSKKYEVLTGAILNTGGFGDIIIPGVEKVINTGGLVV